LALDLEKLREKRFEERPQVLAVLLREALRLALEHLAREHEKLMGHRLAGLFEERELFLRAQPLALELGRERFALALKLRDAAVERGNRRLIAKPPLFQSGHERRPFLGAGQGCRQLSKLLLRALETLPIVGELLVLLRDLFFEGTQSRTQERKR